MTEFSWRGAWFGVVVAVLSAGCSDNTASSNGKVRGGADSDSTANGSGACTNSAGCDSPQVCHAYSLKCVTPGPSCTEQAGCDGGSYCEASVGACLDGVTGSQCATDANCLDTCTLGLCGCAGLTKEQQITGAALDIYLIFDRTGSMGTDCAYTPGESPPVNSKACYGSYALADYLTGIAPSVDTRLAFQFMSQENDCDGTPYETPLVGLTSLPVASDHALIQAIDDETFVGGLGTHIEGALRGLASFTAAHETPGREMIGVLMTDGDPNGCDGRIGNLQTIVSDHYAATGIRTFIIGMTGATEANLESLGVAGGTDSHDDWCGDTSIPCHYWNVGDGSGDAIASALEAIIGIAVPLPCQFDVLDLTAAPGTSLDFNNVNLNLMQGGVATTLEKVESAADCTSDQVAWYYDDPSAPTQIHLCASACGLVSGADDGARVSVTLGCMEDPA